jgi:MFS superfamily sulfate permease-like transporter
MHSSTLKYDLKAGFSVFLLALPLCLGIAIASNFPPIAGIITAIIGGAISSFLGSSRLTIKGPAAGLIVIALGAVNELGGGDLVLGYKKALAVGVAAALLQILFSLFRWAKIVELMPASVIHGMLAAIGIIIISKESHVMMGIKPQATKPFSLLAEIPQSAMNLNMPIFLIGLLSLLIAFLWPKIKKLNLIPASIVVLVFAIPLALVFKVDASFLVSLPKNLISAFTFPDFSSLWTTTSLKYIIMFALVGSIESLLTVCAIDNLDPEKKKSDLNRDLMSVGVGNLISSLVGGLPMISEVVRSKANIDYEAKSKNSNIFHGLFLLLSVAIVPWLLMKIPLSALSALLVLTGIGLASPSNFKHAYEIGRDQFLLFVSTLIITLMTDLLIGVAFGILINMILHLLRGVKLKDFYTLQFEKRNQENSITIIPWGSLVFTSYLKLTNVLDKQLKESNNVILDLSDVHAVDYTIQDKLRTTYQDQIKIVGLENHTSESFHQFSFKRHR